MNHKRVRVPQGSNESPSMIVSMTDNESHPVIVTSRLNESLIMRVLRLKNESRKKKVPDYSTYPRTAK